MTESKMLEVFLDLEIDNALFKWELYDVKIWQYIRFLVFTDTFAVMSKEEKIYKGEGDFNYYGKLTPTIIYDKYIKRNDVFVHKKDVVLITHARKEKVSKGLYKDSYVSLLDEYLQRSHIVLDVNNRDGDYVRLLSKNVITKNVGDFGKRNHISLNNGKISKNELESKVINVVETTFNVSIPVVIKNRWIRWIQYILDNKLLYEQYYKYLLKRIQPKIILTPNGYSPHNQFLFPVARKLNIPTVELEHGIVTDAHAAYNFPEGIKVDAFPDYFFSFGKYEINSARWPIERSHIVPVGYPELEQYVNRYKKMKKRNVVTILFLSSEVRELDKMVKQLDELLRGGNYRIKYRLHPKEAGCKQTSMAQFFFGTEVEIVTGREKTLYECLGEADWVVGMSSTSLYEATAFETRIAIFDHPLSIYSKPIYELGRALLVKDAQDLSRHIIDDDFVPNTRISFFEKNSLQNMENAIEKIICNHSN